MIKEILKLNRIFRISYKSFEKDSELTNAIESYIDDYLESLSISPEEIVRRYECFLVHYLSCCSEYVKNGMYPFQYRAIKEFDRIDYDIALLLSLVLAKHRYKIIQNFFSTTFSNNERVLIVGLGAGIEMHLLTHPLKRDKNLRIDAYDMEIGNFVKSKFSDRVNLVEEKFVGTSSKYETIFAIELLEHLENPMEFLQHCSNSLVEGGRCIVTTATNMPQEDHLFNFDNLLKFENQCKNIGLIVDLKEDIEHGSTFTNINSKNTWYILKKA